MSIFSSIGNIFGGIGSGIKSIGVGAKNFFSSPVGQMLKMGGEFYYNPVGTALSLTSKALSQKPSWPYTQQDFQGQPSWLTDGILGSVFQHTLNSYQDQGIARAINDVGKVTGIPTPGFGSGGSEMPSPTQRGLDQRASLDAAFPELNPWEKAGQSSGAASMGSAALGGMVEMETQKRMLNQQKQLQMMDMSLRAQIADKTLRANLIGSTAPHSNQVLNDAIRAYEGQPPMSENAYTQANIDQKKYGSPSGSIAQAAKTIGNAWFEKDKFVVDKLREIYRNVNKSSIGKVNRIKYLGDLIGAK